jgi:hypothetical protein
MFYRGRRSIGVIGGDPATWMTPSTVNPCRS